MKITRYGTVTIDEERILLSGFATSLDESDHLGGSVMTIQPTEDAILEWAAEQIAARRVVHHEGSVTYIAGAHDLTVMGSDAPPGEYLEIVEVSGFTATNNKVAER